MSEDQLSRIADLIANKVSQDVKSQMSKEINQAIAKNNEVLDEKIKHWFGDMSPTQHTIQHNNINRLLERLDSFSNTFFTGIISKIASWVIILIVAGIIAYTMKGTGLDILK